MLQGQARQAHLGQGDFSLLTAEASLAQFQLLAHAQAEEMAFGKLEHQAAEPASLATIQPLPLPMDGAPARFGQARDQLQQGGFAAAALACHQVGPARF